jgi:hypothetical protein
MTGCAVGGGFSYNKSEPLNFEKIANAKVVFRRGMDKGTTVAVTLAWEP